MLIAAQMMQSPSIWQYIGVPVGTVIGAVVAYFGSRAGAKQSGEAAVRAQLEAAKEARRLAFDTKMWDATRDAYAELFGILDAHSMSIQLKSAKACTDLYEKLAAISGSIDLVASTEVGLSFVDVRRTLLILGKGYMENEPKDRLIELRREFDGHSNLAMKRARKHIDSWRQ